MHLYINTWWPILNILLHNQITISCQSTATAAQCPQKCSQHEWFLKFWCQLISLAESLVPAISLSLKLPRLISNMQGPSVYNLSKLLVKILWSWQGECEGNEFLHLCMYPAFLLHQSGLSPDTVLHLIIDRWTYQTTACNTNCNSFSKYTVYSVRKLKFI